MASISATVASSGRLPSLSSSFSISSKREMNLSVASPSARSGFTPSLRQRVVAVRSRSPASSCILSGSPAAAAARSSSFSSSSFRNTESASGKSKHYAFFPTLSARISAGYCFGTDLSFEVSVVRLFSSALIFSQFERMSSVELTLVSPKM